MSANFDTTSLFLLANEGGFTNDAADSGGPTNFGITQADYSDYLGRKATVTDVRNMPRSAAIAILKGQYWDDQFAKLSQSVATALTDWRLLHGRSAANKMIQQSANALGAKLTTDGVIGPATIAALNAITPAYLISRFQADVLAYLNAIVRAQPSQRVFLAGWTARIKRYSSLV